MKCSNCGQEVVAGADFCGNCGAKLEKAPVETVESPVVAHLIPKSESKGLSIAGMILGILSLVSSFFWPISLPLAIIGLILSIIGIQKGGKGMGITGIVTSVLGIIVTIGFVVSVIGYCESDHASGSLCEGYHGARAIDIVFGRQ